MNLASINVTTPAFLLTWTLVCVPVSPACHDNTSPPLDTAGRPDTGCNVSGPPAAAQVRATSFRPFGNKYFLYPILGSAITDTSQAYL